MSQVPVYIDDNIPNPLLDEDGNRMLCLKIRNPIDDSLSIFVHPDNFDEFCQVFDKRQEAA
jgi:hypothetical protein